MALCHPKVSKVVSGWFPPQKHKEGNPMNNLMKSLSVFGAIFAAAVTTTQGVTLTVDEFGGGGLPSGPVLDPISGTVTLAYTLPFAGTTGDVVLTEPATQNQSSDILRFDGAGHLFFFSDADPADAPADVGVPVPFGGNITILAETGPEGGPNGLLGYTPTPGMPGFDPSAPTYNFISDPVPEPSTWAMVATGAASLIVFRRRSCKTG
jgi:hypothetical protein